jgi:hypothetical protein
MPYRSSRARKQFIADLRDISRTLDEAYSGKCSSVKVQEFALCSAVVLTSAKFEAYLEMLISDWGKAVVSNGVKTERLSRHTRAFLLNDPQIENAYRKLSFDQSESAFLPKIGRLVGTSVFQFATDGQVVPAFQVKRIYDGVKYPSPKNLCRLFRRCGIEPLFPALNKLAKRNVEALLVSFNDVRTEMAHVGMPIGLSAADIKTRINEVHSVVAYVDRVFHSHVCRTTGANCWS